ncbi:hypothetical protein QA640_09220 [Bradyrhizobium sp. CB82]|uniref:hypothetical protein n=1 Tax=Bradyrhizobium sp. CB82 TaxID=3039159 RepID=UPI0024B212C2|nr:hypothetical protein [Bradyrhizobium sp. CB82]WFU42615.1 hypothetical protein QA640_09220 [Bradyrhizobium sp. CB82]
MIFTVQRACHRFVTAEEKRPLSRTAVVGHFDYGGNRSLGIGRRGAHIEWMANTFAGGIHLVQVTTDNRQHRLYVTAGSRDDAVTEGWTAVLLTNRLTPREVEVLKVKPGEVREITQ